MLNLHLNKTLENWNWKNENWKMITVNIQIISNYIKPFTQVLFNSKSVFYALLAFYVFYAFHAMQKPNRFLYFSCI